MTSICSLGVRCVVMMPSGQPSIEMLLVRTCKVEKTFLKRISFRGATVDGTASRFDETTQPRSEDKFADIYYQAPHTSMPELRTREGALLPKI